MDELMDSMKGKHEARTEAGSVDYTDRPIYSHVKWLRYGDIDK